MVRTAAVAVLLFAAGCASPPAAPDAPPSPAPRESTYAFFLDGAPIRPEILSLEGEPSQPRPGDVAHFDGWAVTLGAPGPHRFRAGEDGETLLLDRDGAPPIRAGVSLRPGSPVAIPDAEARLLRCVRLRGWEPSMAALLDRLDLETVCVILDPDVEEAVDLPALPRPLRRLLVLQSRKGGTVGGLESLRSLPSLRLLCVRTSYLSQPFDAAWIRDCADLRFLELWRRSIESQELLGGLRELRDLRLLRCSGAPQYDENAVLYLSWIAHLGALRRLDLSCCRITDLSTLPSHASLRSIAADSVPVDAMPGGAFPNLEEFRRIGGTAIDPGALRAFRASHAGCRVVTSWREALLDALAGADRIRIRTGGTGSGEADGQRTLAEITDRREVERVLESVEVLDDQSGQRCMCGGGPTFEIRAGGTLLASLGVQHGFGLRWDGSGVEGGWPGDAILSADARDALWGLLDRHGEPGPLAEWTKEKAALRALRRRWEIFDEIAPAGLAKRLEDGGEKGDRRAVVRELEPDPHSRVLFGFRLFGSGETTWDKPTYLDYLAEGTLRDVPRGFLTSELAAGVRETAVADGVARWLFGEKGLADLPKDPAERRSILLAAGERGATHPRPGNRRKTLRGLGGLEDAAAREVLRRVLSGDLVPRALPEDLAEESFRGLLPPAQHGAEDDCSDRALAALLLARLDDRESLAAVRALLESANESDLPILTEAEARLR